MRPIHPLSISACIAVLVLAPLHAVYASPQTEPRNIALLAAMENGDLKIIRNLLDHGANPNARDRSGLTPLMVFVLGERPGPEVAALLLKHGADVNAVETGADSLHQSVLIDAVQRYPDEKTVQLLLDRGAHVNFRDRWGRTALVLALRYRHTNLARLLLDHGADPNASDWGGYTPLLYAVFARNFYTMQAIQELIAHGAKINAAEENGETALMLAARMGSRDIVQLLLDKGADVHARAWNGVTEGATALHAAASLWSVGDEGADYPGTIRLLLRRGGAVNAKDDRGDTSLMSAVRKSVEIAASENFGTQQKDQVDASITKTTWKIRRDAVNALLENGADVYARNRNDETVLSMISAQDPAVATLIKAAADRRGKRPETLDDRLQTAAAHGEDATVRSLAVAGADVNARDEFGRTPLITAVELGSYSLLHRRDDAEQERSYLAAEAICRLLLDHGAEVNARDQNGYGALDYAAGNQSLTCVRLLLEHGARISRRPERGTPALQWALQRGRYDVARLLISHGVDARTRNERGRPVLMDALDQADVTRTLLAKGADPNARDNEERTILIAAVMRSRSETIKLLLDAGADVNAKDHNGNTALMHAIFRPDLFFLLLDRGADVCAQDADPGKSVKPIEHLIDGPIPASKSILLGVIEREDAAMIRAVLDHGANPNVRDKYENTALSYVLNDIQLTKLLLSSGAKVNARYGSKRRTALMEAVEKGYVETTRLLIKSHADVNAVDDEGRSVLMYAKDHPDMIPLLKSTGAR